VESERRRPPHVTEENQAVVRRMIEEALSGDNPQVLDEVMAPDYFNHAAVADHQHGIEGVKHIVSWLRAAFTDRYDIEDIVAEGDRVAVRVIFSGTHEGEFMGVPPSGRRISVEQVPLAACLMKMAR
jgi:predicted ester cyclase